MTKAASPNVEHSPAPSCPFCASTDTSLIGEFGCQLMTAHYQCHACRTYFDAIRDDRQAERPFTWNPPPESHDVR